MDKSICTSQQKGRTQRAAMSMRWQRRTVTSTQKHKHKHTPAGVCPVACGGWLMLLLLKPPAGCCRRAACCCGACCCCCCRCAGVLSCSEAAIAAASMASSSSASAPPCGRNNRPETGSHRHTHATGAQVAWIQRSNTQEQCECACMQHGEALLLRMLWCGRLQERPTSAAQMLLAWLARLLLNKVSNTVNLPGSRWQTRCCCWWLGQRWWLVLLQGLGQLLLPLPFAALSGCHR